MTDMASCTEENTDASSVCQMSPVPKLDDLQGCMPDEHQSVPASPASSCSPPLPDIPGKHTSACNASHVRQNHVSTVMLHNIPIVSLYIDSKERLCLAQISNTHLKSYSYNEIHNRRVALGITCVQCTPVQLEILRRAGAMPVSSRRCGMITKREAERLVKSFLEDNLPPKLPDDFSFDVQHECGWGCRGNFEPSRYNSSRAKCIKCRYCNIYFSPNKFIFHFHRAPDAKYSHPDAANFNSWRRHLKLVDGVADNTTFLWEDVKAMFNGGSRKRITATSFSSRSTHSSNSLSKKPKLSTDSPYINKTYPAQYPSFGMFSTPNKQYPYNTVNNSYGYPQPQSKDSPTDLSKPIMSPSPWTAQNNIAFPSYDLFWANTLALSRSGAIRNGYYSNMSKNMITDSLARAAVPSDKKEGKDSDETENKSQNDRLSAFRPVGRNANALSGEQSESERAESCGSPDDEENEEIDVTYDTDDEKMMGSDDDVSKTDCDACDDMCNESMDEHKEATGNITETDLTTNETSNGEEKNNNKVEKETSEEENICDRTMEDSEESDCDEDKDILHLSKDELCDQLKNEIENRKRIEREVHILRETFSEQANREKSYRDEMAHQLQVVRDTLTTELEQEKTVRFALQQKLKEAHDALHSFSCKMLANRQCEDCSYQESPLPR